MLITTGVGNEIFIFRVSSEDETFYPVGVVVRIEDMWTGKLSEQGRKYSLQRLLAEKDIKLKALILVMMD